MKNSIKNAFCIISGMLLFSCATDDGNFRFDDDNNNVPTNVEFPLEGLLGEYVDISGENLVLEDLKIIFDDQEATAYQPNEDTIKVRVPRTIERFNPIIELRNNLTDAVILSSPFQLKAPEISSISPNPVQFEELIWIYGSNFDTDSNALNVTLNNEETTIYRATHDSIQIKIPNDVNSQNLDLKVYAQLQEVSLDNAIQLKSPEILFAPQTAKVGGVITLHGANFNTDADYGQFIINDELEVHIDYIFNADSLRLNIPFGPYEDFVIDKISYETANMYSEYTNEIIIDSQYILYTKNNPESFTTSVYNFNDKSYVFGRNGDDYDDGTPLHHLFELDLTTKTWTKINSVSITGYSLNEALAANGLFYVFVSGFNNNNNTIYEINLNNYNINSINEPPNNSNTRLSPVIFAINDMIYYGKGGVSGQISTYYSDLHLYNRNSGTWNTLNTDDSGFRGGTSYLFQGNTYISIHNGTIDDLKLFDPTNNSFSSVNQVSTFETEKVFIFENNMYRVLIVPQEDQARIYEYNSQVIKGRINILSLNTLNKFFSKDNKLFFRSNVQNHIYGPSNGFYLVNPIFSNQL